MQYIRGAPAVLKDGLQIAGDARYGPLIEGERQEGSDFNDYIGESWTYPEEDPSIDKPEPKQFRCLDCSGFVRMVWGHREHKPNKTATIPLCLRPRADKSAIPRRAVEICASAPGLIVVRDSGSQILDFSKIRVGDLVFFDAESDDGPKIDHVGIYLGKDTQDHHRFISSRKAANGPMFRDFKGKSILDGKGDYARAFRSVRRL
jgi:cell wall-associated NlpC family hydrolase